MMDGDDDNDGGGGGGGDGGGGDDDEIGGQSCIRQIFYTEQIFQTKLYTYMSDLLQLWRRNE